VHSTSYILTLKMHRGHTARGCAWVVVYYDNHHVLQHCLLHCTLLILLTYHQPATTTTASYPLYYSTTTHVVLTIYNSGVLARLLLPNIMRRTIMIVLFSLWHYHYKKLSNTPAGVVCSTTSRTTRII